MSNLFIYYFFIIITQTKSVPARHRYQNRIKPIPVHFFFIFKKSNPKNPPPGKNTTSRPCIYTRTGRSMQFDLFLIGKSRDVVPPPSQCVGFSCIAHPKIKHDPEKYFFLYTTPDPTWSTWGPAGWVRGGDDGAAEAQPVRFSYGSIFFILTFLIAGLYSLFCAFSFVAGGVGGHALFFSAGLLQQMSHSHVPIKNKRPPSYKFFASLNF